jgi:site-specific DNA recombinase
MESNNIEESGRIYGVILVRVSTLKQFQEGSSLDDQVLQCKHYALGKHIPLTGKVFPLVISGQKDEKILLDEVFEYCRDPKNRIKYLIFKSIDRLSRGGSYIYSNLKAKLSEYGVEFLDTYGVIQQPINTLEHTGFKYSWSMKNPAENAEVLEANRAKQEITDILTRMIGAEIAYKQKGYAIGGTPIGLQNVEMITNEGKRKVRAPHPVEKDWIIKAFHLRIEGVLDDKQITDQVNKLGYKTHSRVVWNRSIHPPVPIRTIEGKILTAKKLQKLIQNPEYAGFTIGRWTHNKLVKSAYFDGIVSIDEFNNANRGKVYIENDSGNISIAYNKKQQIRLKDNPLFPYKDCVLCHICHKSLLASSPKSENAVKTPHFPYYHCARNHKYWGVPRKLLHELVFNVIKELKFDDKFIEVFKEMVIDVWNDKKKEAESDAIIRGRKTIELREKLKGISDKIMLVNSKSVIASLEKEYERIEQELVSETEMRDNAEDSELNMKELINYASYFMSHLEDLFLAPDNPKQQAVLFGLIFNQIPTYEDLVNRTLDLAPIFKLNQQFALNKSLSVTPRRVELRLPG